MLLEHDVYRGREESTFKAGKIEKIGYISKEKAEKRSALIDYTYI